MTNSTSPTLRKNISRLVAFALTTIFVCTSGAATPGVRFIPQEDELIADATKAINNAQVALDFAAAKKREAEQRLAELQEFSAFKDPDINTSSSLRRLAHTVSLMAHGPAEQTLQAQLLEAESNLVDAFSRLKESKKALDGATSSLNIEAAKLRVNNKIEAVKPSLDATGTKAPALSGLKSKLDEALSAVYDRVAVLAKSVDARVSLLNQPIPEPQDLVNLFQNKLADINSLIQFDLDLQDSWPSLSAELKKVVSDHEAKAKDVNLALNDLHVSVVTVAANLNQRIKTLAEFAVARDIDVLATTQTFKSDPLSNESKALESIKQGESTAAALDRINSIVESIAAQAQAASFAGFVRATTQEGLEGLSDKVKHLRLTVATLQELLSGDRSLWITEKIRLYYFTDIPRLIRTLNPSATLVGGDVDARRRAADRLDRLRAAEDAQSEASSAVASLKKRVATLRQQLQQANDELDSANILARESARRDAELNRRPAGDVSEERKARSLEEKNRREEERVAAQERADKLNDENNGLAAQLTEAETQLEVAQGVFERASNATIRAAQAESAAFADVRDNAPFWLGAAIAASSDPARRVEITSSTSGENAIFIRGRREDIVKVQDMVAKLDEPAPQARMTLWKIELNSDATKKGAERFNESLAIVEQELASTRAKIADSLSALLEAINEEANAVAGTIDPQVFGNLREDCLEDELYRTFNFNRNGTQTDISGRVQRLKRYFLYPRQVREELGVEFTRELGFANPKQFGLKDPASATTLNEALIVLLLTDRAHRNAIMDRFETRLSAKQGTKPGRRFARLGSMLSVDEASRTAGDLEMTRQQEELVHAIRGLLLKHLLGRIIELQPRIRYFLKLHERAAGRLPVLTADETITYQCLQRKLPRIFDSIHDEFPISALAAMKGRVELQRSGEGTIAVQRKDENGRPDGPPEVYNLRPSPARVAAADGMLDVFTKAVEDDIDREYVQPMLRTLRERLKKTGIGFGVIQRTSVLATNRLVARVDPRATAELAVGQETNLIQGLQQISQMTLAAQTGGVSGALGAFKTLANEKDAAEIYGITSGSAFQVTPIFDPTGQALRFKFDFVDTTLVREPRGTTNPRLPRIERHTVNTEVQLANLEIREVSRFESDSKIGIPTTYKGGLPLLKDIPGIRPVPFIGWFVRRKGSNAIAQRSLIFAQTTMSPTIGDILDLLDTSLQRR